MITVPPVGEITTERITRGSILYAPTTFPTTFAAAAPNGEVNGGRS